MVDTKPILVCIYFSVKSDFQSEILFKNLITFS